MMFRKFLESVEDLFGADKAPLDKNPGDHDDDDLPIRVFSISRLLERIQSRSIGFLQPAIPFNDTIQWGEYAGSVRVKISPNGNIAVERRIQDLTGEEIWITKNMFKINQEKFIGHEDTVADDIFEKAKKVYSGQLDSPTSDFKEFDGLVNRMAQRIQSNNPLFMFNGIKKPEKNHSLICFTLRGVGVGKIVRKMKGGPTPEAVVELKYNEKRGIFQTILTTYSIEGEGQSWEVDLPYFNGFFMPSQDTDEIIDCLSTLLKFY